MKDYEDQPEEQKWVPGGSDLLNCTFCNKNNKEQSEVRVLVAGPCIFICNECVDKFNAMLAEPTGPPRQPDLPVPSV